MVCFRISIQRPNVLHTLRACLLLVISSPSPAELIDRGGGLIYDTELDITWLQDANYASSSGVDEDGAMSWDSANNWASNLEYYDSVRNVVWSDWRLPSTQIPDDSCTDDEAGTAPSLDPTGFNCTGSELGHLYYTELGGTAGEWIINSNDPDLSLFKNIQIGLYWSQTEAASNPTAAAWHFHTDTGFQNDFPKFTTLYAWPVRDGDVGSELTADGDINSDGQVNSLDVLLAARIATGYIDASMHHLLRGDVAPLTGNIPNPDGKINIADLLVIQRKALGLVSYP